MFSKRPSKPIAAAPAAAPPAPPPSPPPPLVRFDKDESRDFVLNIVEVEAPNGGAMRVRLADREGWHVLEKQSFEARFRLKEITYRAWHTAEYAKPDEYFPKLSCSLVCRPRGHTTPLIVFLPDPLQEADELPDPAAIYTCQFSEVSITPGEPDPHVDPHARVRVGIWGNEDEFKDYSQTLFEGWQTAKAAGELQQEAWPRFQLNTTSTRYRRHHDDPPPNSFLQLHPTVFEGLRRDVVALGRSVHVDIYAMIEAYVLERSRNYAPEYGDGDFFSKLVLIPFGAVLTARLKEIEVHWREGGTDFETRMDPPPSEDPAPTLDV